MEHYLSIEYDKEMKRSFESDDHRYNVYVKLCYQFCFENHMISPEEPLIQTVVLLNLDDEETCRKSMERQLRDWPMQTQGRRWLIDCAMRDARDLFQRIPPHHNTMMLLFRVRANHVRRVNYQEEERVIGMAPAAAEIECVIHEEKERVIGMVPASIESLEKKIMDCSICLDDILIAAECFYTPCCHVFHDHCIKKWLKITSRHSCPVCRYQIDA